MIEETKILEGRVTHCNSKGYGFISTVLMIDFYFHHTAFQDNWKELLRRFVTDKIVLVEFENDPSATDGPKAMNVKMKSNLGEKS